MSEIAHPAPDGWLKRFFLSLVILALLAGLLLVPWAVCWLTASGELDQEEVVARQAQGEFVLFGPGLAQDIMAYKLALYAAVKPEVVVLGSSRAGNVRAAFFERPFVNMAGAAADLESLRLLVDRMLAVHRPKVVLLGLDFWWLTAGAPAGRPERIVQPSLLDASTLRAPWRWLVQGRIAPADMLAPLQHRLRADRYGLEAQLRDTGYGPDGSLYEGAVLDGRRPAPDHAFARTLRELESGSGVWAGSLAPDRERLEAFAEICCRLRSRGIRTIVFLPPLATPVLGALADRNGGDAGWLSALRQGLLDCGVESMDFSDPRVYGSGDCEMMDGLHGGDVIGASLVRDMGDRQPWLRDMLHREYLSHVLRERRGLAAVPDERLTALPEADFLGLHCAKKRRGEATPRF
ncbi:hypothetical protein [Desulfovibrio piger]|uniref:Uncharacterized protein n=1 Tax=Desulfovibrio piger TaxID=901 RepID=A0A848CG79_9BACT|nr:hypothetical protein [Desulfovibrio piger]MCI7406444.1 hypothetical protein [Desulfovibrio piger]NME51203.1 hypothetical protein [Desulfovibrio piger]